MLINFNIEKLNVLLSDFYNLTGLTISVWDSDYNQLSYQPHDMPTFCRLIKSTQLGNKRCFECDKELCRKTIETGQPLTHRCHVGLIDTAIPIKFKNHILGFLMFGQAIPSETTEDINSLLKQISSELNLDESLLRESYKHLAKYQSNLIESAANILKMATRYLWLSDLIKIDNNDLIEKIDHYIHTNIYKKITVEDICKEVNISKNKLYSLTKTRLHTTIGDYILKTRLNTAKRLLTDTDLPIYTIAFSIGIAEYNYFTKIFKKNTGFTPSQYRARFPISLNT